MVIDSETINGSVDTDETVISKILNKNQCCHHGKVLKYHGLHGLVPLSGKV